MVELKAEMMLEKPFTWMAVWLDKKRVREEKKNHNPAFERQ